MGDELQSYGSLEYQPRELLIVDPRTPSTSLPSGRNEACTRCADRLLTTTTKCQSVFFVTLSGKGSALSSKPGPGDRARMRLSIPKKGRSLADPPGTVVLDHLSPLRITP